MNYNTAGMKKSDFDAVYGTSLNDKDGDGVVSWGDTAVINGKEVEVYSNEAKPDYIWTSYYA